jgi:hypothetical protein
MLHRDDLQALAKLILDRSADDSLMERLRRCNSMRSAAVVLLTSDEFIDRNRIGLARMLGLDDTDAAPFLDPSAFVLSRGELGSRSLTDYRRT